MHGFLMHIPRLLHQFRQFYLILIKTLRNLFNSRIGFNIFGVSRVFLNVLLIVGALSAIIGVLLAIGQMDIKRLLAYHSISQTGYILLGIGLGTPLGTNGQLFHLLNHATFKSLLFLNSGSVEYSTGVRDLEKMGELNETYCHRSNKFNCINVYCWDTSFKWILVKTINIYCLYSVWLFGLSVICCHSCNTYSFVIP